MAIKLEMNGATFTFETIEEYEAFTKLHNEVAEVEAAKEEPVKVGDTVGIIGNTDYYHDHEIGDVGEVLALDDEDYYVAVDGFEQYVPKQDVKKVDAVAKEEPKKETFYMIKSEYVDTDYEGQRDFKKGADEVLIGNKREADGLIALIADYEFIGDVIERFNGEDHEGKAAFSNEHVYEVTREEYEAKKAAYLAEKDAPFKVGDIITGNELCERYVITTDEALMRVESVSESGDTMRVEVIKHVSRPKSDWHGYGVSPSYFVKTTEEEFDAKHGIETKKEAKKEVPEGYEKVSFADAKEGDYFLALEYWVDIEKGEKYVLTEDYNGDLEFVDEGCDERLLENRIEDEDGIVIRKIVEEETQEDTFKVGDKVRVKAADYHHIEDGYVGTITSISSGNTHKSHGEVIATPYFVEWQSIAAKDLTLVDEGLSIDGDVEVSSEYKIEEGDVVRTMRTYTDFLGDSIKDNRLAIVLETRDSGAITVKQRSDKDYIIINAEDVEDTLELVAKAIK